jgi:SAM-dependent methyltransferase
MDIRKHNRQAWNKQVEWGNEWTIPASPAAVAAARQGGIQIYLTPQRPVPADWLGRLSGRDVLGLASGGGQQGPLLAAAGARVTVLDNSPRQLDQDRLVAVREGLEVATVEGDMADLSMFADASFDLIVHPVSNVFSAEILPVWREAWRVLRPGGALLSGFNNPAVHLFDYDHTRRTDRLEVHFALPYADSDRLSAEEIARRLVDGDALEFSHTLEEQIGGQIAAGFVITGFYEDRDRPGGFNPLSEYMPVYLATRAIKAEVG